MILEVKDISKSFGGLQALKHVNFHVQKGEIHALIGPNGAGKTTLMNIISGLERMDSGDIFFNGKNVSKEPSYKRAILGMARTFQNLEVFGDMTVLENIIVGMYQKNKWGFILSGLNFKGVSRSIVEKAEKIVEYVGLSHRKNELAMNLPVGEQRLLEIGRALAAEPKILLLDEPAAGLNTKETKNLSSLITQIREELGISILIVEHDMELVMGISDMITVLNFGEVIAEGKPLEIQKNPQVISAYLGED